MSRHEILISNPTVINGKMLLMLCVKDWNEYECFHYPAEKIDSTVVLSHVLWKMAIDENTPIKLTGELNINEKDPSKLNVTDWNFYETF